MADRKQLQSFVEEMVGREGQGASRLKKELEAPMGTMMVVLVYAIIVLLLWFWLYYNMLRAEGF